MADSTILDKNNRDKKTPQLPCDICQTPTNYFVRGSNNCLVVQCYQCDVDSDMDYDQIRDAELAEPATNEPEPSDW